VPLLLSRDRPDARRSRPVTRSGGGCWARDRQAAIRQMASRRQTLSRWP